MSEQTEKSPLDLELPQQLPAPEDSFLLDPKQTETWFASLPMANVGETARQIFGALVKFNRLEIPTEIRAKVVEQFNEPVDYLASNLEKHYLDMTFPLPEKTRRIATISRDLYSELAISYKILITDILTSTESHIDQKSLVISLHHALRSLSKMAFRNAIVYAPWPDRLWREVSNIYVYASQNQIHLTPLHKETGFFKKTKTKSTTIDTQFRRLFLFAASAPTRLRQYQILQLLEQLDQWSEEMILVKNHDRSVVNGRFNIDLKEDQPPIHNVLKPPTSSMRYLTYDLNPLAEKLRGLFETSAWEGTTDLQSSGTVLGRQLLKLLISSWTKGPDRSFERTQMNFDLNISVGLDTIYKLASDTVVSTEQPSLVKEREPAPSLLLDNYRQPVEASAPIEVEPPPTETKSADTLTFSINTCNESTGGYCLKWFGEELPKVKTGELLGIQSSTDSKQFGLGIIRWIRQEGGNAVSLGMQMLSKSCTPGSLNLADKATDAHQPQGDCLILPDPENDNKSATLVTLLTTLRIGHSVMLSVGQQLKKIKIERMLESTGAIAQYQFIYVDETEQTNAAPKGLNTADDSASPQGNNEGSEYDDLWKDL